MRTMDKRKEQIRWGKSRVFEVNEKQFAALSRGVSVGFVGKVRFEQRLQKGEIIQVAFLEIGVLDKEKS